MGLSKYELNVWIDEAESCFNNELNTDENKDYRRGFRAGVYCALLKVKASQHESQCCSEDECSVNYYGE